MGKIISKKFKKFKSTNERFEQYKENGSKEWARELNKEFCLFNDWNKVYDKKLKDLRLLLKLYNTNIPWLKKVNENIHKSSNKTENMVMLPANDENIKENGITVNEALSKPSEVLSQVQNVFQKSGHSSGAENIFLKDARCLLAHNDNMVKERAKVLDVPIKKIDNSKSILLEDINSSKNIVINNFNSCSPININQEKNIMCPVKKNLNFKCCKESLEYKENSNACNSMASTSSGPQNFQNSQNSSMHFKASDKLKYNPKQAFAYPKINFELPYHYDNDYKNSHFKKQGGKDAFIYSKDLDSCFDVFTDAQEYENNKFYITNKNHNIHLYSPTSTTPPLYKYLNARESTNFFIKSPTSPVRHYKKGIPNFSPSPSANLYPTRKCY